MMEITAKKPDGIEGVRNILTSAEDNKGGAKSIITYIDALCYRVLAKAEFFKVAEKFLNNTIEKTRSNIERQHGTFSFVCLNSKKSHTLQWVKNSR
jgi:translation initiation factor 2 alpha subunit (eIF-2alpha)